MDAFRCSFIKLFTLSLPLFCLLSWSCGASSTASPLPPQRSSATLAAETLRSRGYSIIASLMVSISATTNFSGTLLAPPDSAFSFTSAKVLNRPPPRPSIPLLFYHTLSPPLILTWPALSERDDGDELRTFFNRNCLFLLKASSGEVSISSSPFKNPVTAVKIRQPDLYVDDRLIVHGIDGVLDPSFATKCAVPYLEPTADAVSLQVSRVFLDRAIRGLWRKGYNVVAAAMATRRSELLSLTSATVFAVPDEHLFMKPGGFHYDFRHHVVPTRLRYADFEKSAAGGMELFTLAPNKTVVVQSVDSAVTVDGVAMSMTEVYLNRWIVAVSIMSSLDDVTDSQRNRPIAAAVSTNSVAPSPSPFPGAFDSARIPSPAPSYTEDPSLYPFPAFTDGSEGSPPISAAFVGDSFPSPSPSPGVSRKRNSRRVPSPAPSYTEETDYDLPSIAPPYLPSGSTYVDSVGNLPLAPEQEDGIGDNFPTTGRPSSSPLPIAEVGEREASSPTPSPAIADVSEALCPSKGVDGDLLCAGIGARRLLDDVEEFKPLDGERKYAEDLTQFYKSKVAENVNIADDVFFYI